MPLAQLSVIIPVGTLETNLANLVPQLLVAKVGEIILVGHGQLDASAVAAWCQRWPQIRYLSVDKGRARQLNAGAEAASNPWCLFLHADSQLLGAAWSPIRDCVRADMPGLWYFDLKFADDGPWLMRLNQAAVWWRSRLLRMPFGDQGFLLPKRLLREVGGFDAAAPYGEDHLLVWRIRAAGLQVRSLAVPIVTSARRYQERGWLLTTARYVALTVLQAIPAAWKCFREHRQTRRRRPRSIAIAVLVKTPGMSPIKTRLAASSRPEIAGQFYELSIAALRETLFAFRQRHSGGKVTNYWAVAESTAEARTYWRDFIVMEQGEGDLGRRLAQVYGQLKAKHDVVMLLGADSPQLTVAHLQDAIRLIARGFPWVLGPAADGGFYLFGARHPIDPHVWQSVTYSVDSTAAQLTSQLAVLGAGAELGELQDVDTWSDLVALRQKWQQENELPPASQAMLRWLQAL